MKSGNISKKWKTTLFLFEFIFTFFFLTDAQSFFWGRISDKKSLEIIKKMESEFITNNCSAVISLYSELMNKNPDSLIKLKALRYTGQCYQKINDLPNAISIYKLAITLYPQETDFYSYLAKIYFDNTLYDNSIELLEKILPREKYNYEIILLAARAYSKSGFLEKAKKYYIEYILNNEMKEKVVLKEFLKFLIGKKDIEDAMYILDSIPDSNEEYDFMILKSRCMAYKKDFKKAIEILNKAEKKYNLDREGKIRKAMYSIFDGNYNIEKELEYFKNDYLGNFIEGLINYKKKNYIKALKNFEISYQKAKEEEEFISELSQAFIKRIKNENKILENVSCRQ